VDDAHSSIVAKPTDIESQYIIGVFHNTPFTFGQNGINGLHYEALADNLRWNRLSRKKYTSLLISCVNSFIKGINSKSK